MMKIWLALLPSSQVLAQTPWEGPFYLAHLFGQSCVYADRQSVKNVPCVDREVDQLWQMQGDLIVHIATGHCLSIVGSRVTLRSCDGDTTEQWEQNADLTIKNKNYGLCLERRKSTLHTENCDARKLNQRFLLHQMNAGVPVPGLCLPCRSSQIQMALVVLMALIVLFVIPLNFFWLARDKGCTCPGMVGELSSLRDLLIESNSKMARMATPFDTQSADDRSCGCTVGSWSVVPSGPPCCFLPDTYLKMVTDDGAEDVAARNLFEGAEVESADGTLITVFRPPEQHQVDAVIELQAGSSSLVVSPDHRILIPGRGNKTVQARELEVGSDVILHGAQAKLTSFEWKMEPTIVVKIVFSPDLPVAGFLRPPAILSKGSREKPAVRRGTRKPGLTADTRTMPDTEPPLTP